jgi:arylsulfatase A-like enzyme
LPIGREAAELVSLVGAVFLVTVFAKAVLAHAVLANAAIPPQIVDSNWVASGARILASCAEDGAVGLACLLIGAVAFRWTARSRWRRLVRPLIYLSTVLALVFLAINVHLFGQMRSFLTLSHVQFAGGLDMERSVAEAITPGVKVLLVLLPLGTFAVHAWWFWAFPDWWQRAALSICRPAILLPAIAFLVIGSGEARSSYFSATGSDFAQNPHLLFARSCLVHPDLGLMAETTEEDEIDFQPGRPELTPNLLARPPKNLVVIVLESVPTCYLDLYGSALPVTPRLCRLKEKGILFENFYATANYTIASALPLFASTYNDIRSHSTPEAHPDFPVPGAAGWLRKQGFQTYFLAAGGAGTWESYRQGKMVDFYLKADQFQLARDPRQPFWSKTGNPRRFLGDAYLDQALFQDAKRVLHEAGGQRFFLMLWNYASHYAYYPEAGPEQFHEEHFPPAVRSDPVLKEEFIRYLRTIWSVDRFIGDFYDELERLGLAEDTLVAITADHGEAFGQHGYRFHGTTLHEEEVHVPLLLLCPRLAPLGPHNSSVGSHIDLWPTLMDICGLPCDPRWQGHSLFRKLPREQQRAYFYRVDILLGLREGQHKYIFNFRDQREQLFDLDIDPGERVNLAEDSPDLCRLLRRRLSAWVQFQHRWTRSGSAGPSIAVGRAAR